MTAIILTFHTLIVLGLIVVVLLQRSDGGALGLGGGGGGFMSGRGAANALTRTTSILAAIFISTSLTLAVLAGSGEDEDSAIQQLTTEGAEDAVPPSDEDLLNTIGADEDATSAASEAILNAIGSDEEQPADDANVNETTDEPEAAADEPAAETGDEAASEEGGEDE